MLEATLKNQKIPRWSFSKEYGDIHLIASYNTGSESVDYYLSIDTYPFIIISEFLQRIDVIIDYNKKIIISDRIYKKLYIYLSCLQNILNEEKNIQKKLTNLFWDYSFTVSEEYLNYIEKYYLEFYIIVIQLEQWFDFHLDKFKPVYKITPSDGNFSPEIFLIIK